MEKRRILIVGDEVSIARTLKMYLEENAAMTSASRTRGAARWRPRVISGPT